MILGGGVVEVNKKGNIYRLGIIKVHSKHWVTVKIGLNGLDPDLDRNKHRINPE
jgi:hypothetical protein